jgi:hypothetical protein
LKILETNPETVIRVLLTGAIFLSIVKIISHLDARMCYFFL